MPLAHAFIIPILFVALFSAHPSSFSMQCAYLIAYVRETYLKVLLIPRVLFTLLLFALLLPIQPNNLEV